MWTSWISAVLGAWLIVAPFTFRNPSSTLVWHDALIGAAILVLGVIGAWGIRWANWTNVVLGLWLIVAPFVLNFTGGARWNQFTVGLVVAILSWIAASAVVRPQHAGEPGEGNGR